MKKLVVAGAASITALSLFLLNSTSYSVSRIIDGDTFVTKEDQIIRLASIDAPENGLCGSVEAKKALSKLILKKPIYLKIIYRDGYNRLVSKVYTKDGFVNAKMIEGGYASYRNRDKGLEELQKSSDLAKQNKKGIFGETCTQTENLKNPSCNIKGNNRIGNSPGVKYYFTLSCRYYDKAVVQLYLGDQWFCTENAALASGYQKSKRC